MFEMLRGHQDSMLGIDISATSVKLLEISKADDTYKVESYAVTPLPSGAVIEKTIKNTDAVVEGLISTLRKSGSKGKHAVIAVADSSVITRVVQLEAHLTDDEMEEHILIEADKYIPYPLEEVRLDFDIQGPSKTEGFVNVLIVASRAENVTTRMEVLRRAGIEAKVVDVESYAMERACSLLHDSGDHQGKVVAVFDIGATMTNVSILHDRSTVFTREEAFGGQRLTDEIQQRYDLTFQEAGLAKKLGNLPDDYESEVLTPFRETAVLQVRRSLQFFFSSTQHSNVDTILLAGGTAQVPGLVKVIEEQVSIPTLLANPFANMAVSSSVDLRWLNNDAPALMICCGLALRGLAE